MWLGIGYLLVVNLVTLFLYWKDKRAAKLDTWRVKEQTLHVFSALGGWPAALLGQVSLRHKTRKISFQIVFYLTIAANLFAVYLVYQLFRTL